MRTLYRTLSFRYFTRRWVRAALMVASIALGVATLVATGALNDTMAGAVVASTNPLAGFVDFIVTNGDLTVSRDLAQEIAAVPGVQSVQPWIWNHARVKVGEESRPVVVIGVDLGQAKMLAGDTADVTVSKGTEQRFALAKLLRQRPAVVGIELAAAFPDGTKTLDVERNGRRQPIAIAGTVSAGGNWALLSGYVVVLEQHDAAALLEYEPGQVNRLDIVMQPGADAAAVREALAARLAGRAHVKTPAEQDQALGSAMDSFRAGFALCGVAALVVGMFLVYNALSVTVAERRHEIGILLAVGATRRQVLTLFAGEAALLGLAGSVLGIPLGLGLAYLGLEPMRSVLNDVFTNLNASRVQVRPGLVLLAMVAGIATTVAASLLPAYQAAQEHPADAVRRIPKAPSRGHLVGLFVATLTLLTAGVTLTLLRDHLPTRWGAFGGMGLLFVAALVASPLCATLAASALRPLARRYFPIEWRLAADNLLQAPGRTGMVIGALAAGVALVMQTAGVIRSNRASLNDWIQESIAADVVITGGSAIGGGGQAEPIGSEVADALRTLPDVEAVMSLRSPKVEYRGETILLLSFDAGLAGRMHATRLPNGGEAALFRQLDAVPDGTLVSDNFAARFGVRVGDAITLPSASGPVTLHVVGTILDYSWNLGTLYLNRRDYLSHWHDHRIDMVDVYVRPGSSASAVKQEIAARYGARYSIFPMTRVELLHDIDAIIQRVYGIAYGQQLVVMLVAGLGVIMSLLISVLQRRREMGLLRAIGAPQTQVIHSVLAEASLMGALGTVLGILFGIPLEWFVLKVVIFEESGFLFPVYIPWDAALLVAAAALVTVTLAGLGPALYAVRQRIPDAIAYE